MAMTLNKQAFRLAGVKESQYMKWCEDYGHNPQEYRAKQEFFRKIFNNQIIIVDDELVEVSK